MSTKASSLEQLEADKQTCIDPNNSVVVTACAGSGKTWLLTSRILRIIIDAWINPQKPKSMRLQSILAITFTNNAAEEIANRVRSRLRDLAYGDEEFRNKELREIGIAELPSASDLMEIYRRFITQRPGLSIHTFHSWFNHLIQYLPWSERTSFHGQLADSPKQMQLRAWEEMLNEIEDDESEMAKSIRYLLGLHKLRDLKKILIQVINKRSEWFLHYNCSPEDSDAFEIFENKDNPDVPKPKKRRTKLDLYDKNGGFRTQIDKLLKCLEPDTRKNTEKACEKLRKACELSSPAGFYAGVLDALFNKDTDFRERKSYLKEVNSPAFAAIEEEVFAVRATDAYEYNRHCTRIALRYAKQYAQLKEREGVMDYSDMELIPLRALIKGSEDSQPLQDMFKRLEDTYEHILVDEFQDTSPAQWVMMRSWLEASKGSKAPTVFIVGDPKQSIFSWRGGNPELLAVARKYLEDTKDYRGLDKRINITRRCSQEVVDAVNAVFCDRAEFDSIAAFGKNGKYGLDSFAPHEVFDAAKQGSGQGKVCCLPLPSKQDKETDSEEEMLRNPLIKKADEREDGVNFASLEGKELAKIIKEHGYDSEDIMLLHPSHRNSGPLIDSLMGANLPCSLLEKSNRMDCLECQDMLALLHAIFDPDYGLMVAQVLRSPIFDVREEDLWEVYQKGMEGREKCSWRQGLENAKGSDRLAKAQKYIKAWRAAYRREKFPAHEMLAKCYSDVDLIAKYVEAVPRDIAKRVVLNLDWILNYSLEAQGGRLVLPSEYAAHLQELRDAEEDSDSAPEKDDVIQSLTVHGAKGLESKVVIVVNSNYDPNNPGARLLVSWDLAAKLVPNHLSFCRGRNHAVLSQTNALDLEKKAREQEKNNLLYVAMTRAKQHLLLSIRPSNKKAAKKKKIKESQKDCEITVPKWWNTVDEHLTRLEADEAPSKATSPLATEKTSEQKKIEFQEWPKGKDGSIRTGKQNDADNEAKIKGTQRHNLLALILQNEEAHEKIMDDNQILHRRLLGIGKDRLKELHGEIEKILAPETEFGKLLAQVDKKKNPIECELSAIVDGEHKDQVQIRRIDCLLTTKDDVVWIIDFKTGGSAFEDEHKNEYDEQLRAYHSVVKGSHLKDKTIKMAIVDREGGMREVKPA